MREIKFRAWDIEAKKMRHIITDIHWALHGITGCKYILNELDGGTLINDADCIGGKDRFILMQYTEKKDKNKKEIYHYDIVKKVMSMEYVPDNCKKYDGAIGKIMYSLWPFSEFVIELIEGEEYSFYYPDGTNFAVEELEIIGNIYEHPELLKEKK